MLLFGLFRYDDGFEAFAEGLPVGIGGLGTESVYKLGKDLDAEGALRGSAHSYAAGKIAVGQKTAVEMSVAHSGAGMLNV